MECDTFEKCLGLNPQILFTHTFMSLWTCHEGDLESEVFEDGIKLFEGTLGDPSVIYGQSVSNELSDKPWSLRACFLVRKFNLAYIFFSFHGQQISQTVQFISAKITAMQYMSLKKLNTDWKCKGLQLADQVEHFIVFYRVYGCGPTDLYG